MAKNKKNKIEIEYMYPKDFSIKNVEGFSATYNTEGFALFSFFEEYPEFVKKAELVFHEDGHMEEVEEDKPIKIIRQVHSTMKMDLMTLKSLAFDIFEFLDDFVMDDEDDDDDDDFEFAF